MKKKIFIIILVLIAIIAIISIITISDRNTKNNLYLQACEEIKSGDYNSARSSLLKIKGYRDSEELLKEVYYQLAIEDYNTQKYDKAYDFFNENQDYKDSKNYYNNIIYNRLKQAITDNKLDEADQYATLITDFSDVAYQKEYILYLRYFNSLEANDKQKADEYLSLITDQSMIEMATRVYEYSIHGIDIVHDLKLRYEVDGTTIEIKEVRAYQYKYNNNVEVPIYMVYTINTDSNGQKIDRYTAYLDKTFYGYCDTIEKKKLNMQDENQLYAFLKIGPFWDQESTYKLSAGLMKALAL